MEPLERVLARVAKIGSDLPNTLDTDNRLETAIKLKNIHISLVENASISRLISRIIRDRVVCTPLEKRSLERILEAIKMDCVTSPYNITVPMDALKRSLKEVNIPTNRIRLKDRDKPQAPVKLEVLSCETYGLNIQDELDRTIGKLGLEVYYSILTLFVEACISKRKTL